MSLCIVTIVPANGLHFARVLMADVRRHHPEATRVCVLLARDPSPDDSLQQDFAILPVETLALPERETVLFSHDIPEIFTTLQPWIFQTLFARGHDRVIFLGSQIRIYRPLQDLCRRLEATADVVLIPHFITPLGGDRQQGVSGDPLLGTLSSDCIAMRQTGETTGFLRAWCAERRETRSLAAGLEADLPSRWLDRLPSVCERVSFLRHPGYHVAPWNVAERQLQKQGGATILALGEELVVFNFGPYDPAHPEQRTPWQAGEVFEAMVRDLRRDDAADLRRQGSAWYASRPYDFGLYEDGGVVTAAERRRFRLDSSLQSACRQQPFSHPDRLRIGGEGAADGRSPASTFAELSEIWQLQSLWEQLLDRPPRAEEIRSWRPWFRQRWKTALLPIMVGASREARRSPGWAVRLVQAIARWPMASGPLRSCRDHFIALALRGMRWGTRLSPRSAARSAQRGSNTVQPFHPRPIHKDGDAASAVDRRGEVIRPINILGYFSRELGIGEAARSLERSCREAGIAVNRMDLEALIAASPGSCVGSSGGQDEHRPIDVLYLNADTTIAAGRALRASGHHSGYRIGFWHWEQSVLPARFHASFVEVDEIWVPSRFVLEAIAPVAPVPVITIPHAVAFTPTPGVRRANFGLPDDKCLVLVMYDFHSVQGRKNPMAAITAFRAAKAQDSRLGLVIKTNNAHHHPRERQELEDSLGDLEDVTIMDTTLTRQQTWDLEMCCDILLSLHRSEGFGLILAEMMFLGKVVVATGWSGNMDFMQADNSVPVPYSLEPLARPIGPYEAGIPWAEPDLDHAAAALRRIVDDRDLAASLGGRARDTITAMLHPQVVGARVRERLSTIQRWFPRAGAMPPAWPSVGLPRRDQRR